jgi:hypothetical protein
LVPVLYCEGTDGLNKEAHADTSFKFVWKRPSTKLHESKVIPACKPRYRCLFILRLVCAHGYRARLSISIFTPSSLRMPYAWKPENWMRYFSWELQIGLTWTIFPAHTSNLMNLFYSVPF